MSDSRTILIADDDPQILRALRITLAARGYEVLTASTGAEAIAAAVDGHPDVILLDLGMPGLGGMDVIHAVRGWSEAPILVVSGRTGSADKVDALDACADDYVTSLSRSTSCSRASATPTWSCCSADACRRCPRRATNCWRSRCRARR